MIRNDSYKLYDLHIACTIWTVIFTPMNRLS